MIPKLAHLSPVQAHYLDFLTELKGSSFEGDICPDYANRTVLSTDNSIYQVLPQGVIYPISTEDLVILCELAAQKPFNDIVLSPRGGGTGTNGQSLTDGLIIDISKHMNHILEINTDEGWAKVQTGVVKDQLNAALRHHGLFFAPDLSTSNRATIGGMINTDASGQGSCLYGKTRDHVLELQTVLMDGSVMHTKSLNHEDYDSAIHQDGRIGLVHRLVNNIYQEHSDLIDQTFPPLNRCLTGYDLAHIRDENNQLNLNNIICGSEGTLGFVTEAKLNVIPIPNHFALVIVKYGDFDSSLRDATELMLASPTSIETIDSKVLNLAMNDFIWNEVSEFFSDETPVPVQGINLVEFTSDSLDTLNEIIEDFTHTIKQSIDGSSARIGYAVAQGKASVDKIWAMRKRAVGLLGNAQGEARPIAFVEDTAVPPEHLADFILEFREILDAYNLDYGMFGHVDAGVLHVRPALDMKVENDQNIAWEISDRIADLTHQYNGVMWGEHGKGVRSEYAPKFFGELYPQLQRIKSAFDPHNQLNPGKIATPEENIPLLKIDEVTTRGSLDRSISSATWEQYQDAVFCNGNGVCYNWNTDDPMCPSWKVTRERTQSPKGRASLIREWLKLLNENNSHTLPSEHYNKNGFVQLFNLPKKIKNSFRKQKGEYDFSHEVYDSMAGCLACKSCTGQCPIKVDVTEFRSRFLSIYHTRYLRPPKDYLVGALEFLLPLAAKVAPLYNGIMALAPIQYAFDKWIGFVDGPALTGQSLKKNGLRVASKHTLNHLSDEEKRQTVLIVQDAFTSYFETQLVIDTYQLLEKLGFKPFITPYSPNGKPMHVHGFLKLFHRVAKKNTQRLNLYTEMGFDMVGIDPSMTLTYRSEYKKTLPEHLKAPNVQLLQEWLAEKLDTLPKNKSNPAPIADKIYTLLPHCTEKTNATATLKQWQAIFTYFGLTLKIENVGCCGMSGTYGHESRNLMNSKKIYTQSWKNKVENKSEDSIILATGYSCRSQVKRESQRDIVHPLQALLKVIS